MLQALSRKATNRLHMVRAFAKKPDIPTKYNVLTIPSLTNNFSYILSNMSSGNCVVIDAIIPTYIEDAITHSKWNPRAVLTTHHHLKHVIGLGEIAKAYPSIQLFGGEHSETKIENERILTDGSAIELDDISFKVIAAPSHSKDSLIYEFTEENGFPFLFTGDSICLGGCGYVQEDQIDSLYSLVYDILQNYPDETCIFHGHENGEAMLRFAKTVEPSNRYIRDLIFGLKRTLLKAKNKPGTPTCLHDERLCNPFFRVHEKEIQEHLGCSNERDAFTELVKRRNQAFKPKRSFLS